MKPYKKPKKGIVQFTVTFDPDVVESYGGVNRMRDNIYEKFGKRNTYTVIKLNEENYLR